ncbi:MAG TPA: DNA gyrase subunit A [Candidatus Kapabacteria bacterium]|nr:DNA gyrase subunit A [Candidatus Kapabacteria bacterium]
MSLIGSLNIKQAFIEDEMKSSYLDYSMSVIVSRALPDVRDGLKPVHRRILYAMNEMGLLPNRAYKKSARLVGEVLGKYHPHGDYSVYEAMVRMAQDWAMRYPLVDGQGNFGSIDGDSAAAMRYTEARMAHIAIHMLRDIDKDTVDFQPNFDDSLKEPVVLPTVIPNLLLNGASGIAVGMATNIPPHNIRDVINALHALIKNPDITVEELIKYCPAPDFPTGGIIYGYQGVRDTYLTGRGKIIIRAKASFEENRTGKTSIIVTEIPYQVNKAALIEKIADLVRNKVIDDISDIRDESDRDGLRIVIELKREATPKVVLNNLYKHTNMQVTFGANMLALVKGRPKVLNLLQIMKHFLNHRVEVVVRRTQFELTAAEKRAHILEGFIIALDNLDEVIALIRAAKDPQTASEQLQSRFNLTEIQAKAILDLRLQRLTGLEREKIQQEYREILQLIEKLKAILASKELQMQIIYDELKEILDKYGDERRTEIIPDTEDMSYEDLIANEEMVISITHRGFIKSTLVSNYRRQNKGGRGIKGASTYEDDFVEHVFQTSSHHYLLFFTNKGRCYRIKVWDIPEASRQAKGRSLANLIQIQSDEKVTAYCPVKSFDDNHYIMMATRNGIVKKVELNAFSNVRQSGIIAINLDENDELISARLTDGASDIILGTNNGIACRFRETDVRSMGRSAMGVTGINLEDNDYVNSMIVINRNDVQVLVVSENGYGKRTKFEDFRLTRRGAKGVISMNVTEKTGKVVRLLTASDLDDLIVITQKGILIRQPVAAIRTIGRNTQGVKLIRLDEGDKIADVTIVNHENDDNEDNNENEIITDDGQARLL